MAAKQDPKARRSLPASSWRDCPGSSIRSTWNAESRGPVFHVEHAGATEWPPGRDAPPARNVRTGERSLFEHDDGAGVETPPMPNHQPQLASCSAGQRVGSTSGGSLTTSAPPTCKSGARTFRDHRGRTERSRHDQVDGRPQRRIASRVFGCRCDNGDPVAAGQGSRLRHRGTPPGAPASTRTHRDAGHHSASAKSRDAAARSRDRAHDRAAADAPERPRMLQMLLDGPWPRKPSCCARRHTASTRRLDRSVLVRAGGRRHDHDPAAGLLAFGGRRTPSSSLTVSCTTLRSAGCIGSSAFGDPEASTSAATCWANRSSASRRR